jgi:hypothetical protein
LTAAGEHLTGHRMDGVESSLRRRYASSAGMSISGALTQAERRLSSKPSS